METLPSPKRIFIVLTVSGFILYVIYGVNTRAGLFPTLKPSDTNGEDGNNTENHSGTAGRATVVVQWKARLKNTTTKHTHEGNRFTENNVSPESSEKELKTRGKNVNAEIGRENSAVGGEGESRRQSQVTYTELPNSLNENSVNKIVDDGHSRKFLSDVGNPDLTRDTNEPDNSLQQPRRKRLPNALIIGVKKGGTRALLEILQIHPDVRASGPEIHFFDRDKNYKKGLEWYRDQMPLSRPKQITIEKSPSYFVTKDPDVPARVYQMSRSIKLVVIVRDPTRRAISDYAQGLSKHPQNPPFEKMLLKTPRLKKINEKWSKVRIGRYAEHYKRWLEYFPPEQFHFVSGEELVKNPATEVKAVEKFLKIRQYIQESNFFFNKSKGFPCFLGKITSRGVKTEPHCLGKEKGRKHPPVSERVLTLLQDYYRPFNEKFYEMVNRNFHWP